MKNDYTTISHHGGGARVRCLNCGDEYFYDYRKPHTEDCPYCRHLISEAEGEIDDAENAFWDAGHAANTGL